MDYSELDDINNQLPYNGTTLGMSDESQYLFRVLGIGIIAFSISCACVRICKETSFSSTDRYSQNDDLYYYIVNHSDSQAIPELCETNKESDLNSDTCAICIEGYTEVDESITLECNHKFHKPCIMTWFKKELNCPLCRKPLTLN